MISISADMYDYDPTCGIVRFDAGSDPTGIQMGKKKLFVKF